MPEPRAPASPVGIAEASAAAQPRHLPATLQAPGVARAHLRGWLRAQRWPSDDVDDLVLAVSEAVSNAVEHAYPAGSQDQHVTLTITAMHGPNGSSRVVISVTDHGSWRPPAAIPGFRGRGVAMMRALTGSFELTADAAGTRVKMISRPVQLTPAPGA